VLNVSKLLQAREIKKKRRFVLEYALHKKENLKKKSYAELRPEKKKRKSHL
jgi:hypothetical protein